MATVIPFPRRPLPYIVAVRSGMTRSQAHALMQAKREAERHAKVPHRDQSTPQEDGPEAA